MTGVTEVRDACEQARKLHNGGHTALALAELDAVTGEGLPLVLEDHPVTAACHALKAEILQQSGASAEVHQSHMDRALLLCERHIDDDFEGVAPVLLNAVRYYRRCNMNDAAAALEEKLLSACERFHGPGHPRYYQLRQWIEDAGHKKH